MKTRSTFFFLTSSAGCFVTSGTILLVTCSENLMDFDTRNVKTRTMERWIVFWMQAHTTNTTHWHVLFSLNTKLGTGMQVFLRFLKPSPLPVMKMLILNTSSMSHMTRVKWQITQINIAQWQVEFECYLSTNVLKYSYAIAWKQICKCCRKHVSIHYHNPVTHALSDCFLMK